MKTNLFYLGLALALGCMVSACQKGEMDPSKPGNLVPMTVDQDPSLPSITVNGAQLHAEAFGSPDSALLVVVHGGPGSDYRSLLNLKGFADDGFRVVFYDQRGSGLSQRFPKSSYSLDVLIDELGGVIGHYKTSPHQKVFLLGHSWGAMLATAYVNAHPEQIDGVIAAEPGGFTYPQMIEYINRERSYSPWSETLNDATYLDQFITGGSDDQEVLDYKLGLRASTDGAKDNPIGNEGPVPFWRAGAVINDALFSIGRKEGFDFTTHLSQYTTGILFAYSQNNKVYGLAHAQEVSAAYPHVQLFQVDDAGHDMFTFPRGWANFHPVALTYLNSLK